jgi:hypothetical protein
MARTSARRAGRDSQPPPAADICPAALLHLAGVGRPWPTVLPVRRSGVWGGKPLEPTLVVEVLADTAHQHRRWRHVVRCVRRRLDLTGVDLYRGLGI